MTEPQRKDFEGIHVQLPEDRQYGEALEVDFERGTLTLLMPDDFKIKSGMYAIIPVPSIKKQNKF